MSGRKLASVSPFSFKRVTPLKSVNVIETIESILRKINFSKDINVEVKLTGDQIHRIASVSWPDGTTLFSVKNKPFIFDMLSMYIDKEIPIDNLIEDLEDIVSIQKRGDNNIIFESNFFLEAQKIYKEDLIRSRNNIEISEGLLPCPKCKSMKTSSAELQIRGGDEGITIRSVCYACQNKWTVNS